MGDKCGIVGFGVCFPSCYRDYHELSRLTGAPEEVVVNKMGMDGVFYAGHDDHTSTLAIKAAEDCLKNTGVDPKEIDLIIYFGENYGDYMIYSIGPAVQAAIGAVNASVYQEECKCCSAIPALQQAKMYIQTDPDIHTVMLVGGYRNNDRVDYSDRSLSFFYNLSTAGAACIIKEDFPDRQILGCSCFTDGRFHDAIVIPGGGTREPFTVDNIQDPYIQSFRLVHPESFRDDLGAVTYTHLAGTLERALKKSGYTFKDLDYYIPLHMNPKAQKTICEMIGLPLEKAYYLRKYGHMGQLDMLIGPAMAEKEGCIKKGDLVGLGTMGISYTWGSAVIRW
ncbi:MAG: 3-oxoacyl-ACP synthase [Lachnospiraceae bacterium]|nr:3-oxoacyl-ACP synthase [Lachnospiraceae bacterium]